MTTTRPGVSAASQPIAYPVPFVFDRSTPPRYRLRNASLETLTGVRFSLLGAGSMPVQAPITLGPGDTAEIRIHGQDLARSTVLVVRWHRANGDEYLWRASF
ncbi:hypothetical protein HII28_04470 [Planctomonas sp. JC2975]|uniref:hypothetical protein n=1 Tax=Planctomonas sp. JC2975 TaxID=2729626 RepID=UPI0014747DD6|nr:hypothetical protein [Planctomonas sp. JC2975]NNC11132.1 hypothetical protein [Planctomonas sp. JC2975]